MSEPVTVSTIIPVYNREKLVGAAIESALAQEVPGHEIIVVDDGSTDGTISVVESYAPRVRLLRQRNSGPAGARNRGIGASSGEFVALLDSDDVWLPGKLQAQIELLQRRPEVALAFTGTKVCDADLTPTGRIFVPRNQHRDRAYDEILWTCFIPIQSVVVRRSALESCGLFNESLWGVEDWDFLARVVAAHPVDFVPAPLVLVRKHEGSMQMDIPRMVAADWKAMDLIFGTPRAKQYPHMLPWQRHRILSDAGVNYFYRGDHAIAFKYLLRSLRYRLHAQTVACLLKCCIPPAVLAQRRLRKQQQTAQRRPSLRNNDTALSG